MSEPTELGQRLADWLDGSPDRGIAREDGRYSDGRRAFICVLTDQGGIERYAASPLSWPDAVLRALTVARFAEFLLKSTGRVLPTEGVFR